MRVSLIGDSSLTAGLNVSMFVSLLARPGSNTACQPAVAKIGSTSVTLKKMCVCKKDGWIH